MKWWRSENRLKVWREYRNLTLAELARTCCVTVADVSQIESGKRTPSVELLVKLAGGLNCDLEDIVVDYVVRGFSPDKQ